MGNNVEVATVVMDKLEVLATKMGLGTEELFSWYVQQMYVNCGVSFMFLILFTVTTLICIAAFKHYTATETKEKSADEQPISMEDIPWAVSDSCGVAGFISCVGAIASLICTIVFGISLFNVKYHAFNNLLDKLAVLF